jgi:hypothetical protein
MAFIEMLLQGLATLFGWNKSDRGLHAGANTVAAVATVVALIAFAVFAAIRWFAGH